MASLVEKLYDKGAGILKKTPQETLGHWVDQEVPSLGKEEGYRPALVAGAIALELEYRYREQIREWPCERIAEHLEPIADMRHKLPKSGQVWRETLTEELVARDSRARRAMDQWDDDSEEDQKVFDQGPGVYILRALSQN